VWKPLTFWMFSKAEAFLRRFKIRFLGGDIRFLDYLKNSFLQTGIWWKFFRLVIIWLL